MSRNDCDWTRNTLEHKKDASTYEFLSHPVVRKPLQLQR